MYSAASCALEAEISAILQGLLWIKSKQWENVVFASDCLRAVMIVLQENILNDNSSDLTNNCRELLQELRGVTLQFEGRGANKLADSIARYAKGKTDGFNNLCILSSPPPVCNKILMDDKPNLNVSSSRLGQVQNHPEYFAQPRAVMNF